MAGVSGTATAAMMGSTSVVYVPGGSDNFYMLNALTGAIIWETNLGTPPGGLPVELSDPLQRERLRGGRLIR